MLDTNIASFIIKGSPPIVRDRLRNEPITAICLSSITKAELLHGVAKNPKSKQLEISVREFLLHVDVLPWNSATAQCYARLRTACEKDGISLSAMDMLIAAHAIESEAVLITNDKAILRLKKYITLQDWTKK